MCLYCMPGNPLGICQERYSRVLRKCHTQFSEEPPDWFPKWLYHLTALPAVEEYSSFSTSLQTPAVSWVFDLRRRISEFKANLVYRVSSRTARAIQRNLVSQKQKQTTTTKTTQETAGDGKDVRKRNIPPLLVGLQAGTTTLVVPLKTGHDTTGGSCYTTPGHIPRGFPSMSWGYMLHYVYSSPIYNSLKLERTQMSFNGVMVTENVVYLHNEILLSN